MKVVAISGLARHGKDTTALMLRDELERMGNRVLITHYGDLLKYICTEFFDWNGKKDKYGRELLQYVGTDIVREFNPNYWVNFITDMIKMFGDKWDYVLIPDARFPNEIFGLKDIADEVIHIRINRPNMESGLTDTQLKHKSETALASVKADFYICNDGTLDDLKLKIHNWTEENIVNGR